MLRVALSRCVSPLQRSCLSRTRWTGVRLFSSDSSGLYATVDLNKARVNRNASPNLFRFVEAYRLNGHLAADLDPLQLTKPSAPEALEPEVYGLDVEDGELHNVEGIVHLPHGKDVATTGEVVEHVRSVYSKTIALEAAHVESAEEREFLFHQLEGQPRSEWFSFAERRNFFTALLKSKAFDTFMTVKFPSFKRYGTEGAESVVVGVESILAQAGVSGVDEVVIGMPHRGRLSLLGGLLDYPLRYMFRKVKGHSLLPDSFDAIDDVTSHIAQSVTKSFGNVGGRVGQPVHVSLIHNPSHLEAANPVAQGKVRCKQDDENLHGAERKKKLNFVMHGDAAFAGQGVVAETLCMANVPHFTVGGTVHMIVNNQVGFTTTAECARSSRYASDWMKGIGAPVLHVNGEDTEAVARACQIAVDFRNKFGKDILVDVVAYRLYGHNEVDEPSFTQPRMYRQIRSRDSHVYQYANKLKEEGLLTEDKIQKIEKRLMGHLEKELSVSNGPPPASIHFQGKWEGMQQPKNMTQRVETGYDVDKLRNIGLKSVEYPEGLQLHQRLERLHVKSRRQKLNEGKPLEWMTAEALAWGSLLEEGYNVRISGEDVERGTFSQRHGVFVDSATEERFVPLSKIGPGRMHFAPSPLSEYSVLGFEYGFSLENPRALCMWEAQFGDFVNTAQVVFDTFVSCGEAKWMRQSGLTLLLPHGYDGAGPEHSSCRLERFLQLTDGSPSRLEQPLSNFVVAAPTTPANYFHLLRRQCHTNYRRPLVVVGPKTLLRDNDVVSPIEDMGPGTAFEPVLDDPEVDDPAKTKTVAFCSGKLYYQLKREAKEQKRDDVAFVRLEELAPFPFERINEVVAKYTAGGSKPQFAWVQEEPENQGAWTYVQPRLHGLLRAKLSDDVGLEYVGNGPLPAPAVGNGEAHKAFAQRAIKGVFRL